MTSFFQSTLMPTEMRTSMDSNATTALEMELPNLLRERLSNLLPRPCNVHDSLKLTQQMELGSNVPSECSRVTIRVPQCYWSVAMGRMYLIANSSPQNGGKKN